MRVRTLKKMNVQNLILIIRVGHVALLAIKMIERSKSLRADVSVRIYQMTRGIKESLAYALKGIQYLIQYFKRINLGVTLEKILNK